MKGAVLFFVFLCGASLHAQHSTITGILLGYDGKPMKKAHVHIAYPRELMPLKSSEVNDDGSFTITTDQQGLLMLQGTGAYHRMEEIPVLIENPTSFEIEIRLAPHEYLRDIAKVGIFIEPISGPPQSMEKQPDGTFTHEFVTAEETIKYRLIGIMDEPRSVNGTQSDDLEYDNGGDYRSVIRVTGGKVTIVFDPELLPRSAHPPVVAFRNDDVAQQLHDTYREIQNRHKRLTNARTEHRRSGKDEKEFSFDWSADLKSVEERIKTEKNPEVRRLSFLNYISMVELGRVKLDSTLVASVFTELPLESPLWALSRNLFFYTLFRVSRDHAVRESLKEEFLQKNPDRNLKASLLFDDLIDAHFQADREKYRQLYRRLMAEFGNTSSAKRAKESLPQELKIAVGTPVPHFSVPSLDDPATLYSNHSILGKTTLIDFWAVWCKPCVEEMEFLHKAYDRFENRNLQILSISFDDRPEDVKTFREAKWRMPWLHAFAERGFESDLAKAFEVIGIPKPILVDVNGIVIAMEKELRGEDLEKTLRRVLED